MADFYPLIANTTAGQIQELPNGDNLNLLGSNIVNAGTVAGTLTTASQPNITSVGTLSSLSVTGNITSGNVSGTRGAFTNIAGTLETASQTNITSVGTLSSLSVTGNVVGGNVNTAGSVTAGGITLNANTISSTGSTLTIDPSSSGSTGNVVIAGNLSVQGTTTTYDSTTVTINDLVFTVANNAATSSAANGGGIEVGPAGASYASWTYDQPNSRWSTALGINATGNISGGNVSATLGSFTSVTGNGAGLSSITGANVTGTVASATTAGTVTTAAQPNITSVGTLSSLSVTANITGGNLITAGNLYDTGALEIITGSNGNITLSPNGTGVIVANKDIRNGQANGVGNIGTVGGFFNTIFAKATSAQYADLAEMYVADAAYEPGTVVVFGGDYEITISSQSHSTAVAGIISTNPSYLMNSTQDGEHVLPVALTGRVPCRVQGPVRKGDVLVASETPGVAQRIGINWQPGCVLGKSLENVESNTIKTIEVAVGRF